MKQQLQVSSETDALTYEVWDHGQHVVPSSGTISISRSADVDVGPSSVTVAADGTCSYVPGSAVTGDYGENLRAEWTLNFPCYARRYTQLFDVVQFPIRSLVTDEDLVAECAELQRQKYIAYGTAQGGGSSEITDQGLMDYPDDHFKGGTVEIVAGTNAGQVRRVSTSVQSTGKITVSSAFAASIDDTSEYVARRTYQKEIDRAFGEMCADVDARGYRPALIVNSEDLKTPHVYLTLAKVCRDLAKSSDDIWWARAEKYAELYTASMSAQKWQYDSDEDKEPDMLASGVVRLRR